MPAPITGQVSVTGTAQPLAQPAQTATAYTIYALSTNSGPVYIGGAGVTVTTGHAPEPGRSMDYEKSDQSGQQRFQLNVSDFYVVGTAGDKITWFASPQ